MSITLSQVYIFIILLLNTYPPTTTKVLQRNPGAFRKTRRTHQFDSHIQRHSLHSWLRFDWCSGNATSWHGQGPKHGILALAEYAWPSEPVRCWQLLQLGPVAVAGAVFTGVGEEQSGVGGQQLVPFSCSICVGSERREGRHAMTQNIHGIQLL